MDLPHLLSTIAFQFVADLAVRELPKLASVSRGVRDALRAMKGLPERILAERGVGVQGLLVCVNLFTDDASHSQALARLILELEIGSKEHKACFKEFLRLRGMRACAKAVARQPEPDGDVMRLINLAASPVNALLEVCPPPPPQT